MEQNAMAHGPVDQDQRMKSQMEKMVSSYDAYMRKVTLGENVPCGKQL